jgi:hypothetical protein
LRALQVPALLTSVNAALKEGSGLGISFSGVKDGRMAFLQHTSGCGTAK